MNKVRVEHAVLAASRIPEGCRQAKLGTEKVKMRTRSMAKSLIGDGAGAVACSMEKVRVRIG